MKVAQQSNPASPSPVPVAVQAAGRPGRIWPPLAAFLLAALGIAATWAAVKPVGDLFVALAAGRDIVAGKLGQPDDWSFITGGRVWINQNWLSHLLIYLSWRGGAEAGVLALKAVLLAAMGLFLALLAHRRGCTWTAALLLAAGLVAACSPFTQLRANLLTLVLIPLLLWLLHRSADDRRRIWWTVPVLLAWANLHGGFVFALGTVGLWAICMTVQDRYRHRHLSPRRAPRSRGHGASVSDHGRVPQSRGRDRGDGHAGTPGKGPGAPWSGPDRPEQAGAPAIAGPGRASSPASPSGPGQDPPASTWPLWACAAACIAAAAASPFGLHNLSHPLVIAASSQWRQVPEWRPLLESPFAVPRAFFVVIGLLAVFGIVRLAGLLVSRREPDSTATAPAPVAFEWLLAIVAVLMAFQSQRFVPLVMLAAAGPLATSLARLVRRLGWPALAVLAASVLLQVGLLARQDRMDYRPDNPLRRGTTLFDRMHFVSESFPTGAAQFLADNDIRANAICEWEWEGYLRWVCPQVKVFIGGRAQQIYSEQDLAAFTRLYDPGVAPAWCRANGARVAVLSFAPLGQKLMGELLAGGWAVIYSDSYAMVLVDPQADAPLLRQAQQGLLKYPSPPVAALSRAACLTTTRAAAQAGEILAAVQQANAAAPLSQAYLLAAGAAGLSPALRPAAIEYLQAESSRLARTPPAPADRQTILLCRRAIQAGLAGLYAQSGQTAAARAAQAQTAALDRQIDALQAEWN